MTIKGRSFSGSFAAGGLVNFDVGSLASIFSSNYTVAIMCRQAVSSSNNGYFGAFSDTGATSILSSFFSTTNTHGRMFGESDFSDGYPSAAELPNGLDDNLWRWLVKSKPTGSAHYRFHYANLDTLVWSHGEAGSAANHGDPGTPAVMFSTWANYSLGYDAEEIAAIVIWDTNLSDAAIELALTHFIFDASVSNPAVLLLFDAEISRIVPSFTPASTDTALTNRNIGLEWSSISDVSVTGLWWYQPNHANRPTTMRAVMYNSDGTSILGDSGDVDISGFSTNVWSHIPFATPVAALANTTYVANVFFTGAVSYTDNLTNLAVKSPERRITVPASGARYVNFGSLTFPSNTFNGLFGLDIDYFDPVTDEMGSGVVESHRQFTNPAANPTGIDFSVDPPVRLPDRVPATAANDGAFRFGLDFTNSHTIVVPGVWWYWVSGGPSAITPRLFDGSTLVAFGTSVSPSGPDGWRFLPFDSPYLIRAGLTHTVAVSIADGNYKYDASGFIPGGGIISGDGGVTITQGRSESGAGPARPANTADSAAGLALAYTLSDLETLFTTQLPSSTDLNEASPLTIGTTIIFSTAGEIQGVRFFMPLNPSGTYTGAVYVATHNDGASDGSLVASTSFTSQVPGAWNTAWFDEPVLVDATQIYKVVIFSSTGRYVASNHVFTSAAIVNGHLTGVQDAVDAPVGYAPTGVYRNGVYSTSGSLHYPDSTFNENNYFVDPVFLANATEDTGESVRFFAFF